WSEIDVFWPGAPCSGRRAAEVQWRGADGGFLRRSLSADCIGTRAGRPRPVDSSNTGKPPDAHLKETP
ncbi:MAG TPA: hypothetical protein VGD46_23230, partial [Rhizobacter sp.]